MHTIVSSLTDTGVIILKATWKVIGTFIKWKAKEQIPPANYRYCRYCRTS